MSRAPLVLPLGARFGRWTVSGESIKARPWEPPSRRFQCVCDCGTVRDVVATTLAGGYSRSCGCQRGRPAINGERDEEIRRDRASGTLSLRKLGRKYGVSRQRIHQILRTAR